MEKLTEKEAYERYDNMLDELQPLDGIACNAFSVLLAKGDETAYNCGFSDFCDTYEIEVVD